METKRALLICLSIISLSGNAAANNSHSNNEVVVGVKDARLKIEVLAPDIIHVILAPADSFSTRPSLSVVQINDSVDCKRTENSNSITLFTGKVYVEIDRHDGSLVFKDRTHRVLLSSAAKTSDTFTGAVVENEEVFHVRQDFRITKDEGLYGLGQFEDPFMDYRGKDILIAQSNRTAVNPFLVSTRGYGILWNNPSESRFHDGEDGMYFWSEVADQVDYYVVYGPTIDEEIACYRKLTGAAPLYGKWAYGYWQSKERYKTSDELIGVVKQYRDRKIPIDNIVQDWQYWGDMDEFSGMIWDSVRYRDPAAIIDTIHTLHAHLMATIWPAFGTSSGIYNDMKDHGFLFPPVHWCGGQVYDAWNPAARDLYWKYVKKGLFDEGVDAFWMDATEPEFRCTDDRYITKLSLEDAGRNYLGTNARYLDTYSLEDTRGIYEHQREASNAKRVFILTRSTFTGQQRFAAATWSGDTFASWDALKVQIAAGINFCMSGLPYWTNDIGGFITAFDYPDGVKDNAYKELYVRWFEFGAFNPIFRSHGTNTPREIWNFGSPGDWAYDALVKFDKLRYRLMPYIYSEAWRVTHEGYTMMRGLPMDFTGDRRTFSIGDQFMFGPSIMVCPVTKPMYFFSDYDGVDITPDHFYSPDGKEHGARLDIYRGTSFDSLVLSRKFDASQIGWIGCLPSGLDTSYSLRITGKLKTEGRGVYKFYVLADAGVRLWIDGRLIIDNWNNTKNVKMEGDISLAADTKYDLKLEHKQFRPNTANLKLNWIVPRFDRHRMEMNVYLPKGRCRGFYNFWTGVFSRSGTSLRVSTPMDMIPIYVPAGSIIPLGPNIQYASQDEDSTIELRIYPGNDAHFDLYEDENDSYDYEKGLYSIIPISWNNSERILSIGDREGEFPGMVTRTTFRIVVVTDNHGTGVSTTGSPDRVIYYEGKMQRVKL